MVPLPRVAVQHLNPRHREDIARHLLRLPEEDRRLRFGRHMRDDMIREYVDGINFERDRVFGVQDADLNLIGFAHLALDPATRVAELGVSVDPSARGKGYGFALLERVVLHATNLGYRVTPSSAGAVHLLPGRKRNHDAPRPQGGPYSGRGGWRGGRAADPGPGHPRRRVPGSDGRPVRAGRLHAQAAVPLAGAPGLRIGFIVHAQAGDRR